MKQYAFFFFYIFTITILECKVLPKYFTSPCIKSNKDYQDCSIKVLRKWGPHLINGVKEINFPKLSPLQIPFFMVNRTLNEFVTIRAILKNVEVKGYETTALRGFFFDPYNYNGTLHLHISHLSASMEYDITGNLFGLNIGNIGYFEGESNDITLHFEFQLKLVDKLGIKYFEFKHFNANSTIGNGRIKMTSKNVEFQPVADLIANFFNENPKRVIDAVQPIYVESVGYFYKELADQVLRSVPANEIVPE